MTGEMVLDLSREGIWVMILVGGPALIVSLVVGIVFSLVQALTQIQESTLAFVPKALAIFVTLVLTLPFMGSVLVGYMTKIADLIVVGG